MGTPPAMITPNDMSTLAPYLVSIRGPIKGPSKPAAIVRVVMAPVIMTVVQPSSPVMGPMKRPKVYHPKISAANQHRKATPTMNQP